MRSAAERNEWIARCDRIREHLEAALMNTEGALPASAVAQIREWIEHNENGLALESLLLAAAEQELSINEQTAARLDGAAQEMNGEAGLWRLPLAPLVQKLKETGFT